MRMVNSDMGGVTTDRNLYDIIFTLIWKDGEYFWGWVVDFNFTNVLCD